MFGSFKNGINSGILAGIVWGWLSMLVNFMTGAFPYEHSVFFNLGIFTVSGVIFGVITAGFLVLIGEKLPFKSVIPKAALISTAFWIVLRVGGEGLAFTSPDRYHPDMPQTLQGLLLAPLLGVILGVVWQALDKEKRSS